MDIGECNIAPIIAGNVSIQRCCISLNFEFIPSIIDALCVLTSHTVCLRENEWVHRSVNFLNAILFESNRVDRHI